MHLLPQLAEVERRFPDELVIIGVHAPKYPAERDPASLREAVLRNEVAHPVVNDAGMAIWQSYGVRAWPTLAFIDPRGNVVGVHEGEAPADALIDVVQQLVAQAEPAGILDRGPVPDIVPMPYPSGPLVFPEKVLADPEGDRLIIANSGRNQLVVARLDGSAARVIGSGEAGLTDGGAATARFHHPQGLALSGDTLYVADTRNHAIRQVSLTTGDVRTIAGTGHLGMTFMAPGPAREVDLRSPWDLALDDGTLYIAMAGTHQLWALDLNAATLQPYAGTGHEGIRDDERRRAWLAQPSGLAVADGQLYVADSETSAIRAVDLTPGGAVRTLVGTGLFDFGDVDGPGDVARLQHSLGVAAGDGAVYVADSYNHKIKQIDLVDRHVVTRFGSGEPGHADGGGTAARFAEPGGIAFADGRLYIADTNNHAIRVGDLATGVVTTLPLAL